MRPILAFVTLAAISGLAAPAASAKERTSLQIVVNNHEGKPVSHASVVVYQLKNNKKKIKAKGDGVQLKTSNRGTAPLPPLQQGDYMVQVISPGYATFGGKVELTQLEQTFTVTLEPPRSHFSGHEKKE